VSDLLREIDRDLQTAPANRVLYLEGTTDVGVFFALLGVDRPLGDLHDGVAVRGLPDGRGSGSTAVEARVNVARDNGRPHVYGVVDGDGRDLEELDPLFSGPGPLFAWRTYDIENLLVRAGWPPHFPPCPDWPAVMRSYSGLVAVNRLGRSFREALKDSGLLRFLRPSGDGRPWDRRSVRGALERHAEILRADHVTEFEQEADAFEAMVDADLDAAHARLDGKWLVKHHVGGTLKIPKYREEWIAHVAASGGLPEVRALWDRVRLGP
jgi:hypothetical protein